MKEVSKSILTFGVTFGVLSFGFLGAGKGFLDLGREIAEYQRNFEPSLERTGIDRQEILAVSDYYSGRDINRDGIRDYIVLTRQMDGSYIKKEIIGIERSER